MKIMTEIELKPFIVPTFARAKPSAKSASEGGTVETPGFHLSDLTQETLDDLALQWIADLYKKAGKRSPFPRDFPKAA